MTEPSNTQEKILVIKLGALGDFIQSLGPMAAIRDHHPRAEISLLTTESYYSLGRECGYFDHVVIDDKPKWKNFSGWKKLHKFFNGSKFTRVYDLQNNDRTAIYFRLFKTKPEWVGAARGASHQNNSPSRTTGHAYDGHVQTLKIAGINNVNIDDMSWVKGDTDHFHIQSPYVLLIPGSAPSRPEKRWPAHNYKTLARNLYGWGYTPVIIGTNIESETASLICETCPSAADLTGKTSISDIVLLARHAAAAIGNDTGPMHIIAPTGCPTYVLFSAHSNPVKHGPIGENVTIISHDALEDLSADNVLSQLRAREFRGS